MFLFMIVAFIIGYAVIALEHPLKINKTATALLLGVLLWVCAVVGGEGILVNTDSLREYVMNNPGSNFSDWLIHSKLIHALGEISEILFFLLGAMTIVELIDAQGGFKIITDKITTKKKVKLLWILSILTFFMSAALDNLTTSIVMVALLRKIVGEKKDRWFFASMIILAANSGGAWSPIGDVTTIMLWIAGKVSTLNIIEMTFLASLASLIVPLGVLSFILKGEVAQPQMDEDNLDASFQTQNWQRVLFLCVGVGVLLFVPVFKTITHLPPYIGMLGGLGIMWLLSEIVHRDATETERSRYSITTIITRVDVPSIMFFLGILLAINALQAIGHLSLLANSLDGIALQEPSKYYVINLLIGLLSSIVDNVPLVAGAIGMYDFPTDHYFWEMLAYCAGTGGSILIIGSAAGVAVMGMEKIDFIWYLKHISWIALLGYFAGAGVFIGEKAIRTHFSETTENKIEVEMNRDAVSNYLIDNTFYYSQSDSQNDVRDSIVINFLKFDQKNNQMIGMKTTVYESNYQNDTLKYYSTNNSLMQGQVEIEIPEKDTVANVLFGNQLLFVTQSGQLIIYNQNGSPVELKKAN
jgi:Na+/H+ antiporter NhaD/arsenite permease-like protein